MNSKRRKLGWRTATAGALVVAGLGAGGALLSSSADAATSAAASVASAAKAVVDETKSVRPDEHLLTGATAEKVRAAALAKYPGATIQRVETDSDGVYEAHLVTKAGERVIVQVGKDFAVTGTQRGGPGGHGGPPGAAQGPGQAPPAG